MACYHDLRSGMSTTHSISASQLPSNVERILEAIRQGDMVVVEREGRPEAALVDIVDFRILRAVMAFLADGPPNESFHDSHDLDPRSADPQDRFDYALAQFLSGSISLSRTAEMLDLSPAGMRARFGRMGIPQRISPSSDKEAADDVAEAIEWPDEDF